MKFWFYAVILANVIFFLWEMQRESFRLTMAPQDTAEDSAKQILLLSELPEQSVLADGSLSAEDNEAKIVRNENINSSDEQSSEQVVAIAQDVDSNQPIAERGDLVQGSRDGMETAMPGSQQESAVEQDSLSVAKEANEKGMAESEETASVAVSTFKERDSAPLDNDLEEDQASESEQSAVTNEIVAGVEKASNIAESVEPESESQPVAEIEAEEQALAETAAGEEEGAPPVCYEVGPFSNKQQLTSWLDNQQIDRTRSEPIYKDQQMAYAYLVFYPAAETFAESKKNETMLKEKGVTDLWLFRKGEMKGMISLGLFREKFRAERLLHQLDDLDVAAEIQERYKNEQVLYVRVRQAISLEQPEALTVTDCAGSSQAGQ